MCPLARAAPCSGSLAQVRHRLALGAALLLCTAAAPGNARAADPIMPLEQVRPGMRCTALSVVRGTEISRFDIEVIDVIRGDSASSGPRILFRASGPAVDSTGIGPGFSGSPILCPDDSGVQRNAGAISEGIGEYGNKVALATPIELVLGERPRPPRSARRAPGLLRRARRIATPLTVTGLSASLRARLSRASRRAERPVFAAPSGPFLGFPVQDLRPGAAVSAALASGDVSISAIGTVAYRDGAAVWAFGHPLDALGPRALLLQDAYVYTVVNNPLGFEGASTYKLAVPGHTVGTLSNDTLNAVIGRVGEPPRTVPVTVKVRSADTGRTRILRSRATDERHLELGSSIELGAVLALGQGLIEVLGADPPRVSTSMCLRVRIAERSRPLGFCNRYLEGGGPFEDLSVALLQIDAFEFGPLTPRSVRVSTKVERGASEAFLLGAQAPSAARAGERIRVRLKLRRSRGPRTAETFTYRIPPDTEPGDRVLTVRGVVPHSLLDASEELLLELFLGGGLPGGGGAGPRSIEELAQAIADLRRRDGVRATFERKARGPVVLPTSDLLIRGRVRVPIRVTD